MSREKRGYVVVGEDKRILLVDMVERLGFTIKEAAQAININYSTAKFIIKNFKLTGKIEIPSYKRHG